MSVFDPAAEVARLKHEQSVKRRRNYWRGRSQLDRHTAELLALHDAGARPADLRRWLAEPPRRLKVAHSTVVRWLTKTLSQRDEDHP